MGLKRFVFAVLVIGFVVSDAYAQNGRFRRRGTILGGVAGAAIGAAIGDRSNNEAVGAVIGGVTGATIGRQVGSQRDYRVQQQNGRYYRNLQPQHHGQPYTAPHHNAVHHGQYPQPAPVVVGASATQPIMQADVLAMLRSGLSEQMIANQIQNRKMRHQLSVKDVIALHQQGVSESLIALMQSNAVSQSAEPRAVQKPQMTAPIHTQPQVYVSPQVHASGHSILQK